MHVETADESIAPEATARFSQRKPAHDCGRGTIRESRSSIPLTSRNPETLPAVAR
jgi:hypothetical protein